MKAIVSFFAFLCLFGAAVHSQTPPNWVFASTLGGAGTDYAGDLVTDNAGNVYVIGSFNGPQLDIGSLSVTNRGGFDMYVAKFSPVGAPIWLKSLGSTKDDMGYAITTDGTDIYATGSYKNTLYYTSTNFVPINGLVDKGNIVVFKMEGATGNVVWANSAGGTGFLAYNIIPNDIALTTSGTVLVAGTTEGEVRWGTTPTNFTVTDTCNTCGFVSAWGKNVGSYGWTYTIRSGFDYNSSVRQISLDSDNNIYAVGNFRSMTSGNTAQAVFPNNPLYTVGSPGQTTLNGLGNQDFFVAKLAPDGLFLFAKNGGSSASGSWTDGNAIWVDKAEQAIYVGGAFRNSYFYSGSSAGSVNQSGGNAFLLKADLNGNEIWERHSSTTSTSGGNSMNFISGNGKGGIYFGISAQAPCDWYGNTAQGNTSDFSQVMLGRLSASGNTLWTKNIDGGAFQFVMPPAMHAISSATTDECWVAGNHSGFGIYFDTYLVQSANFSADGLVAKLGSTTSSINQPQNQHFTLYPNPSSGTLNFTTSIYPLDFKVYDLQGKILQQQQIQQAETALQLSYLDKGVYLLEWGNGEAVWHEKWVKE